MPIGWRTNRKLGWKYLHIQFNVSKAGFSRTIKIGPWSRNSRTRQHRLDLPWIFHWQGKRRGKGSGGGKGKGGKGKATPPPAPDRGPLGAVFGFPFRLARRGAAWGARQTKARARGYREQLTGPYKARAAHIRAHGFRPVVVDAFTGVSRPASEIQLPEWPTDDGDQDVREEQRLALKEQRARREEAWLRHAMRPRPLTLLERAAMRRRGEDPQAWQERSERIRAEVLGARARRQNDPDPGRREPLGPVPGAPPGVLIDPLPVGRGKGHVMAATIKNFTDLHDPDIDEHEYGTELPAQLQETSRLFSETGGELDEAADGSAAAAEALRSYAAYLEAAEVDPSIIAQVHDAAASAEAAATAARTQAQEFNGAAESLAGAGRSAESVYGDEKHPRFDKAG